jgi:hypothetical protein
LSVEEFRTRDRGERIGVLRESKRRSNMRASLTKIAAVSVAAITLGAATIGAATPASAAGPWHGGGGFRGGWHGGGWRGGWGGGWGWGAPLAFGALAGAALAAPYYYGGYGYYGDSGCVAYQPAYDQWGNYLGQRPVNMC